LFPAFWNRIRFISGQGLRKAEGLPLPYFFTLTADNEQERPIRRLSRRNARHSPDAAPKQGRRGDIHHIIHFGPDLPDMGPQKRHLLIFFSPQKSTLK